MCRCATHIPSSSAFAPLAMRYEVFIARNENSSAVDAEVSGNDRPDGALRLIGTEVGVVLAAISNLFSVRLAHHSREVRAVNITCCAASVKQGSDELRDA